MPQSLSAPRGRRTSNHRSTSTSNGPSADDRVELARARVDSLVRGWRLVRLLGVGPVTAAYEAARSTGERGTLKIVRAGIGPFDAIRSEFLRGAYTANRFHHPRVLAIVEDGVDEEGAPFVVRAWSDAIPLSAWVGLRVDVGEASLLRIAEQTLDALEFVNAHGILHGAISPENVLVTPRTTVRLCDFACPPDGSPQSEASVLVLPALRAGPFTAPERCMPSDADAAEESGDLYSLAACLFYAITREPPRKAAHTWEDLHRTPARALRSVAPEAGELLATVLDRALRSDPSERYPSAYAMLGDVRRVMAGRAPKLGAARRPILTGRLSEMALARRSLSPRTGRFVPPENPETLIPRRAEWKGNVVLILAIALLVALAAAVIVRERAHDRHGIVGARAGEVLTPRRA